MYVIAGIDGTGDYNEAAYALSFKNSFVKRMTEQALPPNVAFYQRGPGLEGYGTGTKGQAAAVSVANTFEQARKAGITPGVFLTGFSRGGASAIHAAKVLSGRKIIVDALFLFDAVDRAFGVDTETIPLNVKTVYHAMRDGRAESRQIFANTGLNWNAATTAYHKRSFFCTHGAVGGTPWNRAGDNDTIYESDTDISKGLALLCISPGMVPICITGHVYHTTRYTRVTIEQERAGSDMVFAWMSENFKREKDKVLLRQRLQIG